MIDRSIQFCAIASGLTCFQPRHPLDIPGEAGGDRRSSTSLIVNIGNLQIFQSCIFSQMKQIYRITKSVVFFIFMPIPCVKVAAVPNVQSATAVMYYMAPRITFSFALRLDGLICKDVMVTNYLTKVQEKKIEHSGANFDFSHNQKDLRLSF